MAGLHWEKSHLTCWLAESQILAQFDFRPPALNFGATASRFHCVQAKAGGA